MNLAAVWKLPICFFIENNRYAVSTHVEESDGGTTPFLARACLRYSARQPEMLVAEVIMSPEVTSLLHAAKDKGCSTHPGKAMLDGQLAEMFDFFIR